MVYVIGGLTKYVTPEQTIGVEPVPLFEMHTEKFYGINWWMIRFQSIAMQLVLDWCSHEVLRELFPR